MYFTSIVDLKPFDQYERNISRNDKKLPIIKRNVAYLNQNRKFLINKNMRLYEPIHEAAVMSKIDKLRQKLASTKIQKCSPLNNCDEKIIEIYKESLNSINNDCERKCLNEEKINKYSTNVCNANNHPHNTKDHLEMINDVSNHKVYSRLRGVAPGSNLFHCFLNKINPLGPTISKQERIYNSQKPPKHFPQNFHEPNYQFSQIKVQHLIRQSTRNRFSNIYKTDGIEKSCINKNVYAKSFVSKTAVNSFENMNQYTCDVSSVNNFNLLETAYKGNENQCMTNLNLDLTNPTLLKYSKSKNKLSRSKTMSIHCNSIVHPTLKNKKGKQFIDIKKN